MRQYIDCRKKTKTKHNFYESNIMFKEPCMFGRRISNKFVEILHERRLKKININKVNKK